MKKIILLFLIVPIFLFSHKINIFTYKEENKIFVEGYFSDGKPVKNSLVEIYNEKDEKILEGKTDEKGVFSFDIPDVSKIKIVLTGDTGHKTETFMELEEKKKIEEFKKQDIKGKETKKEEKQTKSEINKEEMEEEIRKIIEETIEKQMNNFLREYRKEKEKEKINDIFGGIGYILGILGIYLYFKSRTSIWKK